MESNDFPVRNEGFLVMVGGLVANVIGYPINVIVANSKSSITTLPFEKIVRFDFMSNQMRRTTFSFLHQLRYSQVGRKTC
jgi:hypothetical protein